MDREGIDVFMGTKVDRKLNAILCNVDVLNKDSEIKFLTGCTEDEVNKIYEFLNKSEYMKSILIKR